MVNYRYYLEKLEDNSTSYQETKNIDASEQVRVLAMQTKLGVLCISQKYT